MFCWWVEWWVEGPQKERAPWIGALRVLLAEEAGFEPAVGY